MRWLIVLAMMIIPGIVSLLYLRSAPHKPIDSIAVLPFLNASGDSDAEMLCDRITASLTLSLAKLPNLRVASRDAVMRYKSLQSDVRTVGHELGVRAVVQGSIERREDSYYIRAELNDAGSNELIWSQQYPLEADHVAAAVNEIIKDIADHIRFH
ncbi:MAG: hypothetical protein HY316_04655 [Acidobacteria bacterium]|nr:hypothetical protein [Acidobacteriota bacterium]